MKISPVSASAFSTSKPTAPPSLLSSNVPRFLVDALNAVTLDPGIKEALLTGNVQEGWILTGMFDCLVAISAPARLWEVRLCDVPLDIYDAREPGDGRHRLYRSEDYIEMGGVFFGIGYDAKSNGNHPGAVVMHGEQAMIDRAMARFKKASGAPHEDPYSGAKLLDAPGFIHTLTRQAVSDIASPHLAAMQSALLQDRVAPTPPGAVYRSSRI